MKKITQTSRLTSPRLIQERDSLILQCYLRRGLFIEDIAQIFRLKTSRVSQILKKVGADKKTNK